MLCDRLTDDISPANAGKADARTRTGDPFITSAPRGLRLVTAGEL